MADALAEMVRAARAEMGPERWKQRQEELKVILKGRTDEIVVVAYISKKKGPGFLAVAQPYEEAEVCAQWGRLPEDAVRNLIFGFSHCTPLQVRNSE